MANRKIMILENQEYSFNLELKNNDSKVVLNRSGCEMWTNPNERVCSLKDDGNGVKIKHKYLGKINLDHCEVMELYYLLHSYVNGDSSPNPDFNFINHD